MATAALAAAGGVLAWFTISDDILERAWQPEAAVAPHVPPPPVPQPEPLRHCGVEGPPLTTRAQSERAPA